MDELEDLLEQYRLYGRTCTNYLKYDYTKIRDLLKIIQKLTTSFTHSSPTSTAQQPQQHHQPQTIGLKTPRMETPTCNGDPYSFYLWLSTCSKSFDQSNCNSITKTQLMLQAMPLDKKSAFVHIDSSEEFKSKLINKFGNLEVFRREALKQFSQLDPPLHSMHDLTTLLAPRIDKLKSYIESVANFEEPEALYATTLSSALNNTIIQCLPVAVCIIFIPELSKFKSTHPANQMPPAIFQFIAKSVSNLAKDFYSYPLEFDDSFIPASVGVKQVHIDNQTRRDSQSKPQPRVHKPCSLCSYKGFEEQHYPLSNSCGVKMLSSQEILKIMDATRSCLTCVLAHSINYTCISTRQDGTSKVYRCLQISIHSRTRKKAVSQDRIRDPRMEQPEPYLRTGREQCTRIYSPIMTSSQSKIKTLN